MTGARPGEQALPFDPGVADDARLAFIGRIRSPWSRGDCPKNLREARERGGDFRLQVDTPFRPGLAVWRQAMRSSSFTGQGLRGAT